MSKESTPLMRQYWEIKNQHADKILLFRMGDFFEIFHEDAKVAAPILGIALTSRNKKALDETPMCGAPHHSIAGPINKLLKAGYRIAICDQLENPATAKGLVKRGVTRVLTPGMVYDPENLNPEVANYIASFDQRYMSFIDSSSGESFYLKILPDRSIYELLNLFPVVELVLESDHFVDQSQLRSGLMVSRFAGARMGLSTEQSLPESATLLRAYLYQLSGQDAVQILRPFEERIVSSRMRLSSTVYRHLEFFSTYRGDKEGSLFWAIDRTRTSAGARLLRQWMCFPLLIQSEIEERHDQVHYWQQNLSILKQVRELLVGVGDLERRLGKVSMSQANGRDLRSLASSLSAGLKVLEVIAPASLLAEDRIRLIRDLVQEIDMTLVDEPPLAIRQGGLVRKGFKVSLDEWIDLASNSHLLLQQMEEKERVETGISSLKIRYNSVFGYYIEVTQTHKDKVPGHYLRKQTLANAERFCTPELIELEKKVLSAESRRSEIEYEIFTQLKVQVLKSSQAIQSFAETLANLDVMTSLSWLAIEKNLCRPKFIDAGFSLRASKHPVVEAVIKNKFVSNSVAVQGGGCLLLTGPNMAGKSTLMRQVAVAAVMAQMGSYVPASAAELSLFDAVYTRVGASDLLSEGLSTFMVEMTETAEMLKRATSRSLVVLDEIGRGTSTYDGLALAQSILEYLVTEVKCCTLFATHYHELTELNRLMPEIFNAHMSVIEKNGNIDFLHTLRIGPAGKSYGIQVGKLAGIPKRVTDRAQNILQTLESGAGQKRQLSLLDFNPLVCEAAVPSEEHKRLEQLKQQLLSFPLAETTPLAALSTISNWQQMLSEDFTSVASPLS